MKRQSLNTKHKGFSLVELMVAMVLGLLVLATVSTILVTSKRTYTTQDRLARLQENARFAMQFLIRDLRSAGYYGCMDDVTAVNSTLKTGTYTLLDNFSIPLEGVEDATGSWYPSGDTTLPSGMLANTDALLIRKFDPNNDFTITSEMPNQSAELNVSSTNGIATDDILTISDCSSADIFQVTAVQDDALKIQHRPGEGNNPGNKNGTGGWLSKAYAPPATIMKFVATRYYVKNDGDGIPTLYRQENTSAEQPLVQGIENFQILYGKDTDSDGVPNIYLKAGESGLQTTSDWSGVISVRIGILARTISDKDNVIDTKTYDVNGYSYTPSGNDKYTRRVFISTVLVRNS